MDDDSTAPDITPATRTRGGRPPAKTVDERIEATLAKLHALRTAKGETQRKKDERLKAIIAAAIQGTVPHDPDLRAMVFRCVAESVTRPADRELVQAWIMSFHPQ